MVFSSGYLGLEGKIVRLGKSVWNLKGGFERDFRIGKLPCLPGGRHMSSKNCIFFLFSRLFLSGKVLNKWARESQSNKALRPSTY